MADNRDLTTRITIAEQSLNRSFGISEDLEGSGANRFLDLETLADAYKEESSNRDITKQFLSIAKAIRTMRSSYLPIDFFLNNAGQFSSSIVDKVAPQESYENAFMRMLGMPSVSTAEFGISPEDVEIRSGQNLKTIDPFSGNIVELSFEDVKAKILDERQRTKSSRRILIDNNIYNIGNDLFSENVISIRSLSVAEIADLLGTNVDQATGQLFDPTTGETADFIPTELTRESQEQPFSNPFTGAAISSTVIDDLLLKIKGDIVDVNIQTIEQDLWKFAYLLIPPIQSAEISRCINETDKIVAAPFTNTRTRRVNDVDVRPSLLEAVIRIRLDKVSGSNSFLNTPETETDSFSIEVNIGNSDESVSVDEDDYGVLESLFILRLRASISGLAQKLYSDIDIMINEMKKTNRMPATESSTGQSAVAASNEAAVQTKNVTDETGTNTLVSNALTDLEQQKLIEDSILFLLGDNSEVLDLQSQTQRSSNIYNSHMMSGLISIVDVPRKRINEETRKIIDNRNAQASLAVEQKAQEIGTVLGTDIGIGTVDLAVFSLALFTLSEKSLLGLLTKTQYERIKNGEFKSLLPGDGEKEDSLLAINEFSQLVIDGYKLFIDELKDDARVN